jgi:hypothetical protein
MQVKHGTQRWAFLAVVSCYPRTGLAKQEIAKGKTNLPNDVVAFLAEDLYQSAYSFLYCGTSGRKNGVGGLVDQGYVRQENQVNPKRFGSARTYAVYFITPKGKRLLDAANSP